MISCTSLLELYRDELTELHHSPQDSLKHSLLPLFVPVPIPYPLNLVIVHGGWGLLGSLMTLPVCIISRCCVVLVIASRRS